MISPLLVIVAMSAAAISIPIVVVAFEVIVGSLAGDDREPTPARRPHPSGRPAVTILIPAQNEETSIEQSIESLAPELGAGDLIVVVADNCSDDTAQRARSCGVEVIERHDERHRGKGYALARGLRRVTGDAPPIVIIIDADCTVAPGSIEALAEQAASTRRPAQAISLSHAPQSGDALSLVSAFAFMIKNEARPRGCRRLGMPIPLTGTGMAFPVELLTQVSLATDDIVEDLSLGLDLLERGYPAGLCVRARVSSPLPHDRASAAAQRARWEHGYLGVMVRRAPRLVAAALCQRRPSLLAAALDLAVPPLSLLMLLALGCLAITAAIGASQGLWTPAIIIACALTALGAALMIASARFGPPSLPARALLSVPAYVLWKVPIYVQFVFRRHREWNRTRRPPEDAAAAEQREINWSD